MLRWGVNGSASVAVCDWLSTTRARLQVGGIAWGKDKVIPMAKVKRVSSAAGPFEFMIETCLKGNKARSSGSREQSCSAPCACD